MVIPIELEFRTLPERGPSRKFRANGFYTKNHI